jgi:hypothetical protein
MSGQREIRHFGQCVAVDPQDIHIPFDKISYIEIPSVGAECDAFSEATHIGLRYLADCLSVDFQESHIGSIVAIKGGLRRTPTAVQDQRGRITARRAHRQPLWTVADHDLIDDTGRACIEVDDADSVDLAVLAAADVVDDRELAVRRDLNVSGLRPVAMS